MKNNKRNKLLNIAKEMPPLRHCFPGEAFDIRKSDVVHWLISQPDIQQYIFEKVKNYEIKYNKETGRWEGVDGV